MSVSRAEELRELVTGSCRLAVRWLVNPGQSPLENVCLSIEDGRLADIRPADSSNGPVRPLMLIPPLVNAHTHLEFSDLTEPLRPPTPFPDWIRSVIRWRREAAARGTPDVATTATAIQRGIEESRAQGVQLIGEIATTDPLITAVSPRCLVFREAIGLGPERIKQQLGMIDEFLRLRPAIQAAGGHIGLSPHAPYSVHLELLQGMVERAQQYELPLAMHIAETHEERQLLGEGNGLLADFLKSLDLFDSLMFPGNRAVTEYLELLAQGPRALIVHGNWLDAAEIDFIAAHRSLSVVYCPRTHAWFGHPEYPLRRLLAAGVRVILGTDSRASNPDLSIWSEIQHLLRHHPWCSPLQALDMVTCSAAASLGIPHASQPLVVQGRFLATVLECPKENSTLRECFLSSRVVTELSGPDEETAQKFLWNRTGISGSALPKPRS